MAGRTGIIRAACRSSGNTDSGNTNCRMAELQDCGISTPAILRSCDSAMRIVFYISGHGFGHTSRSVELIKAILAARPQTPIVVKTSTPAWLFETIPGTSVSVVPFEADTGITQHDSVSMDERDSLRRAFAFYGSFEA